MKKIFVFIGMTAFLSYTGFAQIQKGDILPGLALNASYSKTTDQDDNTLAEGGHALTFGSVMYALDSNNMIGIALGFNYVERSGLFLDTYPFSGRAGFGFMYQRNFRILPRFYANANAGIYLSGGNADVNSDRTDYFGMALTVRPGLNYFIGKHIAIEASFGNLGYGYSQYTQEYQNPFVEDDDITTHQLLANFDFLSLYYGIRFRF